MGAVFLWCLKSEQIPTHTQTPKHSEYERDMVLLVYHSSFTSKGAGVTGSLEHQLGMPAEVPPDREHTTPCDLGPRLGVEAGL